MSDNDEQGYLEPNPIPQMDAMTTRGSRRPHTLTGMPPIAAYNLGYREGRASVTDRLGEPEPDVKGWTGEPQHPDSKRDGTQGLTGPHQSEPEFDPQSFVGVRDEWRAGPTLPLHVRMAADADEARQEAEADEREQERHRLKVADGKGYPCDEDRDALTDTEREADRNAAEAREEQDASGLAVPEFTQAEEPIDQRISRAFANGWREGFERAQWGTRWDHS